ncbi:MAG TPA: NfeD family protein [Cyclobacteriaceae bacterium]|nr:NfeD family protein [Cyclobacteriaceae bacterium]
MWLVIAALILAGLLLIIVEIVFIPGTTVVGFLGLIFTIVGIVFSYSHFGSEVGFYVLLGTTLSSAAILYLSFRKGAWKKFSHQSAIDSKVNEGMADHLSEGEEGTATSVLRPMGSAEFNGKIFEVKTNGEFVNNGVKVRIVKIRLNDILVEPIQ